MYLDNVYVYAHVYKTRVETPACGGRPSAITITTTSITLSYTY